MGYSRARVADVADLTPNLRRIVFDVNDLPGLGLPGGADEAVGIYFPHDPERVTPDMECRDGTWAYYDTDSAASPANQQYAPEVGRVSPQTVSARRLGVRELPPTSVISSTSRSGR